MENPRSTAPDGWVRSAMHDVLISEQAERTLIQAAADTYPVETGGLLLGVRARASVWITSAVEIRDGRASSHYHIPEDVTIPAVEEARMSIDRRLGYLGDWHSHAIDRGPSAQDRAVMRVLSWFLEHQPPGGPLLVLVRRVGAEHVLDGYRARFPILIPVRLRRAGPLPK